MAADRSFHVGQKAFIRRGREILVLFWNRTELDLPGGRIQEGEIDLEAALKREVREETGLEIEPGPLTGVYQNMPRHIVAMVFRCTVAEGRLRENDEVMAFCWATPDQVDDLMAEAYSARVLDGLANLGEVALRSHDGTNLLRA